MGSNLTVGERRARVQGRRPRRAGGWGAWEGVMCGGGARRWRERSGVAEEEWEESGWRRGRWGQVTRAAWGPADDKERGRATEQKGDRREGEGGERKGGRRTRVLLRRYGSGEARGGTGLRAGGRRAGRAQRGGTGSDAGRRGRVEEGARARRGAGEVARERGHGRDGRRGWSRRAARLWRAGSWERNSVKRGDERGSILLVDCRRLHGSGTGRISGRAGPTERRAARAGRAWAARRGGRAGSRSGGQGGMRGGENTDGDWDVLRRGRRRQSEMGA